MSDFIDQVVQSAAALRGMFVPTPLQKNNFLSQKYGCNIYLKREDFTPVRSYKIRGAFNFISKMINQVDKDRAFVCASAGNHAQGVAYVCRHFSRRGVIFMPVTTPQQKVDKTRAFGDSFIEIRLVGDTFDECYAAARAFVEETGNIMAPPFDHERIIEGQATVAYEIEQQWQAMGKQHSPDMIVVPVGGGGLASGISQYVHEKGWQTRMKFAEPEGAASLFTSLREKRRLKLEELDTFVDGAAVAELGELTFEYLQHFDASDVIRVPENRLCATMVEMLNVEGIVLEPAGALSIDALKSMDVESLKGKSIVLVVSGSNFDFSRLPDVKERALRYQGLKKYFIFRFPQRPGALRTFLDQLGPEDDIARFEYLKKSARSFGSVLIAIETKHKENFAALEERFKAFGWAYRDISEDQLMFDLII